MFTIIVEAYGKPERREGSMKYRCYIDHDGSLKPLMSRMAGVALRHIIWTRSSLRPDQNTDAGHNPLSKPLQWASPIVRWKDSRDAEFVGSRRRGPVIFFFGSVVGGLKQVAITEPWVSETMWMGCQSNIRWCDAGDYENIIDLLRS